MAAVGRALLSSQGHCHRAVQRRKEGPPPPPKVAHLDSSMPDSVQQRQATPRHTHFHTHILPLFSVLCFLLGGFGSTGVSGLGARVPARQVPAVGKPPGPLTILRNIPPPCTQGRGQLKPRRHQHCSCWGLSSISGKTNCPQKQRALKWPKARQEETHRELLNLLRSRRLCSGRQSPTLMILASILQREHPVSTGLC